MEFKKIKNVIIVGMSLMFMTASLTMPAFAKDKKNKKTTEEQQIQMQTQPASELYPEKYTAEYIEIIKPTYKDTGKSEIIYVALDLLKNTNGEFSRNAILGNNLSGRPVKIEFKDLSTINKAYATFDALGWKKGKNLYIYINPRHESAPAIALAALLAHEALHQDEYNSLAEETYAWTMEASVWNELSEVYPEFKNVMHPLVSRENTLEKLFIRGNYSSKYIKKTVTTNNAYKNLPTLSPGFEDL
ncbi:MAG: hypothetical protein R3Y28_01625 [Candidatus Gastranaerophilales bacterium]